MRLICLNLLALLLCNTYSIEFIRNEDFTKQITDLNNDVLYIILNRLELNYLMNIAEAIPQLSGIVGEVFRRKYPNLELEIRLPNIMDRFREKLPPNDHRFEIDNVSMALGVLKHFRHFIQSLRIDATDMGSSELAAINRFANIYCSETLKQFETKSVMVTSLWFHSKRLRS